MLIDPVYYRRAGPLPFVGPRRVRAPGVRSRTCHPSRSLLSRNHYDHCDLGTLRLLGRRFQPRFVTPLGNGRLFRSAGIRQVEELDWWKSCAPGPVQITVMPAQHFSARGPFDRNRALWGGFLVEIGGLRILHDGVPATASLPRNRHAAEPDRSRPATNRRLQLRWFMRDIHMNPAEAVQAHLDLGARQSIAMHFGTFQLTPEGIDEPLRELEKALRERGMPRSGFMRSRSESL